jgi:hypothetical protein
MRTTLTRERATAQTEEERWQCATCSAPREEGGDYCMSCRMYWEDCEKGLWDDT